MPAYSIITNIMSWDAQFNQSQSMTKTHDLNTEHASEDITNRLFPALPIVSLNSNRKDILDYFENGWALTECLFSSLINDDAYYVRPYHQLRHPMIFYYTHPTVFYVNKCRVAGLLDKGINAEFESLFEVGVDEMRWDDLHESNQDVWPQMDQIRDYRQQVYNTIKHIITTSPLLESQHFPITQENPLWALVMGFEHERIHLETSSVLIRELPIELVKKPENWPQSEITNNSEITQPIKGQHYPDNPLIKIKAQEVTLGKAENFPSFGWDNEYGSEIRKVRPFSASSHLITNGEFFEFVADDGYIKPEYWSDEGWEWRSFRNIKWPCFWVQNGPGGSHLYKLRTIFEVIDMQWDWPACVNFHEAKAFCAWKTAQEKIPIPYRLLTEAEHVAIRGKNLLSKGFNLDLVTGSERPVTSSNINDHGFTDIFGNVWQWCEDHFHPLPGAKVHPYYVDFSLPCYDGEHQMILGGSFISTGDESTPYARFHFRPHFYQHAGFRIARYEDGNLKSDAKYISQTHAAPYETQEMINRYMVMHWGDKEELFDSNIKQQITPPTIVSLPETCANLVTQFTTARSKALDLGCAVGRSSFELAKAFNEVLGIDYSNEFIKQANLLKANGEISYQRKIQGNDFISLTAKLDPSIDYGNLHFQQGDACNLPTNIHSFDAVLLANVLCRLPDPIPCLTRMQGEHALVKPGGILVMTTPFSWLEEYTPKENWLNGVEDVQHILDEFNLIHEEELPFMIREHSRKYEYIITKATVWKRNG